MLQTLVCAQLGARFPPGLLPCKLLVSPQHWGLFSCYFFPSAPFLPDPAVCLQCLWGTVVLRAPRSGASRWVWGRELPLSPLPPLYPVPALPVPPAPLLVSG